jgi:uncharacterized protein YndB with AHSA1/START domain
MARKGSSAARKPEEQEIVITRIFDAPRDLVFKAWTEPERVKRWWGPKSFTTPVCKIDLRTGGVLFYCMRSPDGKDYWGRGVFKEIVKPERIVCTDTFADEKGNKVSPRQYGMSPDWPDEAIITVTFEEHGGRTSFMLQHGPFKPGDERDMCHQGWSESLDKLEDYLAKS